MRVSVYKLRFPHGVHIGAYGIGTEGVQVTISSDTLFSALLSAWIGLGNDPDAWCSQFPCTKGAQHTHADPPFLLTSAFPYRDRILFFPKPIDPNYAQTVSENEKKKWKKLDYISEAVLSEMRKGTTGSKLLVAGAFKHDGNVFLLKSEAEEIPEDTVFWRMQTIPRVAVDRTSSASNLFHVGRVEFAYGAGLWFGVIWRDPYRRCGDYSFKEAFEISLKELSRSGIGGERTYGYGVFEIFDKKDVEWPDPEPGKPALLLSRYNPRPDELPDVLRNAKGYALEEVRGWTYSPHGQYRRRSIVMLKEGSVLVPEKELYGHVVDVGPIHVETQKPLLPHPVWRYGLAALYPLGGGR